MPQTAPAAAPTIALQRLGSSDQQEEQGGPPPRVPTYIPLATATAQVQAQQGGAGGGCGRGGVMMDLVPIRVDVDVGGHRIVDAFLVDPADARMGPEQASGRVWCSVGRVSCRPLVMNLQPETNHPPNQTDQIDRLTHAHTQWASRLVADLELPGGPHGRRAVEARVAQSIREQLAAYDYALCMGGGSGASVLAPLSLRVRAAGLLYEDTVEWDVFGGESDGNSPEAFAMRTVADLGLPPEFEPAIALSLREQILAYREVRENRNGCMHVACGSIIERVNTYKS